MAGLNDPKQDDTRTSREKFLALPLDWPTYCGAVDTIAGLWAFCKLCDKRIPVKDKRPFTIGTWNAHRKEVEKTHQCKIAAEKAQSRDELRRKAAAGALSEREMSRLKQDSKKQKSMTSFFTTTKDAVGSVGELKTAGATTQCKNNSTTPAANRTSSVEKEKPCQGLIQDFAGSIQDKIAAYCTYAAMNSDYTAGLAGGNSQIFSKLCTTIGITRTAKNYHNAECKQIWQCVECAKMNCTKIRQTVTVRGKKIQRACTILTRDKLSLDDYDDMKNFNKTAAADYNEAGKFLKIQIGSYISFYRSIRTQATCKDGNQVENVDTFLQNFTRHYEQNNTFRSSLVVCLMKAFVAKCDGAKNQPYEAKVLNFMLALSASGDRKAFEYVSANLCSVSLRHIERLTQARRPAPFIGISQSEIVIRLRQHFDRIRLKRKQAGSSRTRVAFSVGFDGTVLVKSYQILHSSNVIVGGAYPNHYIPIPDNLSGDELCTFLKGCVDGKLYGEPAAEIKVCVVSIQDTHGLSPYFTLVGRPQSINENNDFGKTVMEACAIACKEDGDATILNTTTDGVSSEVQWNLRVMFGFLSGQIGYVSLPDTNHNVKNARYQLIGGSSSTVLGSYVFDPWYLKLAGINQKLWRIDDFASDAVVLSLASVKTIQALQSYTEAEGVKYDIGNYAVTVVSLVFLRLRAYAVNANGLRWRDRALYSFITFLWFSSIQCSTMLANKRNLLLETFGVMFLVSRSDVAQPRRTTSECNEHTYGMWRMQLREFNIEQLIRIVQKAAIKLDSLFESGLEISRKNAGLSGYQATLPGFLNSLATAQAREEKCGPVDVDPSKEVVHQLWDDVKGVIEQGIAVMLPFLRKFGAVEGNGLSPFATKIETPSDLQKMILAYFATASVLVSTPSDKNLQHGSNNNMPGIIGSHINDIQSTTETTNPSSIVGDDDNVEVSAIAAGSGDSDGDGDWEEEGNEHVISFDPPSYKGKTTFDYFMMLLQTDQLCDVGLSALKLIELLQLGKLDKGAVSTSGSGKFNSLSGRWFSAKKVSTGTGIGNTTNLEEDGVTMIRRDSIITLNAKNMDKVVSEQDFRVLSIYHKHNNKWYMDIADEVVWNPKKMKEMKTRRIMASMVRKVGTEDFEDVRTDSLGQWSHSAVYCVAGLNDVVKVVGNIIVTQQQDA